MSSIATKRAIATALAGVAIATSIGAPAVSARTDPSSAAGGSQSVPPPPSSMAISAAEEYERLRAGGAEPVADEPSPAEGFDVPSAAIGAAAGTGLVIVLLAAGGLARRRPPGAVRA
jgi:hypothetical protein